MMLIMVTNVHEVTPEVAENVRDGIGTVSAHKLIDLFPGSSIKSVGVVRLEPGASVGDHSHQSEEDFYYCISGTGIVVDNGVEHPFTPGTLQITRSGESQAIRNTGETELVFLGALVATDEM
jgi:mannose-6-phosphate isomerase-like protein (cupin superfamily)